MNETDAARLFVDSIRVSAYESAIQDLLSTFVTEPPRGPFFAVDRTIHNFY